MRYNISKNLLAVVLMVVCIGSAKAEKIQYLAKSPDGQYVVVNVDSNADTEDRPFRWHFEIRTQDGKTLVSQLDQKDLILPPDAIPADSQQTFSAADNVLWRADSRAVAISTRTCKFASQTLVFFRRRSGFQRVPIPEYEPFDEIQATYGSTDSTGRDADHWDKQGNLVLDITLGHHTKSEPPDLGYYATVRFHGDPPIAERGSRTPTIDRDKTTTNDDPDR